MDISDAALKCMGSTKIAHAFDQVALRGSGRSKMFAGLDTKVFAGLDSSKILAAFDTKPGLDKNKMFAGLDTKVFAGLDSSKILAAFDTKVFAGLDTKVLAGLDTKVLAGLDTKVLAGLDSSKILAAFGSADAGALREQGRESADLVAIYAVAAYAAVMFFLVCVALYLRYPQAAGLVLDATSPAAWAWLLGAWIYRSLAERND